jgi:hypothetical protein
MVSSNRLQVLFFVGTFLSLAKPFVRTSGRVAVTAVFVSATVVIYHKQEALESLFQGPIL